MPENLNFLYKMFANNKWYRTQNIVPFNKIYQWNLFLVIAENF